MNIRQTSASGENFWKVPVIDGRVEKSCDTESRIYYIGDWRRGSVAGSVGMFIHVVLVHSFKFCRIFMAATVLTRCPAARLNGMLRVGSTILSNFS